MKSFEQYIKESYSFRLGGSQRKGFDQTEKKSFEELKPGDVFYAIVLKNLEYDRWWEDTKHVLKERKEVKLSNGRNIVFFDTKNIRYHFPEEFESKYHFFWQDKNSDVNDLIMSTNYEKFISDLSIVCGDDEIIKNLDKIPR